VDVVAGGVVAGGVVAGGGPVKLVWGGTCGATVGPDGVNTLVGPWTKVTGPKMFPGLNVGGDEVPWARVLFPEPVVLGVWVSDPVPPFTGTTPLAPGDWESAPTPGTSTESTGLKGASLDRTFATAFTSPGKMLSPQPTVNRQRPTRIT